MKRKIALLLSVSLLCGLLLGGCGSSPARETESSAAKEKTTAAETKNSETRSSETRSSESTAVPTEAATDPAELAEELTVPTYAEGIQTLTVTAVEGTGSCWQFDGRTLCFSGITEDTVCRISGEFDGAITVDAGEEHSFELELSGATLYSDSGSPITVLSADKFTLSAKKDSKNYIYDTRAALDTDDDTSHAAAIFADCDLDLEGKGSLTVISTANNGIHSKDDLKVKNLNLTVSCADNALKGNDSVEIESGTLTLIATAGDAVKTSNTDLSSKGRQRGSVSISGGTVTLYAACDGIDAAYNADISGDAVLSVFTDSCSPYSAEVEAKQDADTENSRFIRFNLDSYSFSVKYYNSDSDYRWTNASFYKSVSGGFSSYYYYRLEKLTGYSQFQIFIYSSEQKQGQDSDYLACSDYMSWNAAYDTFAMQASNQGISYNWTNYSSSVSPDGRGFGGKGGMGGMGGMSDGNSNKGDYSTKGIKAGNEILISGGVITVEAYDDALHASQEGTLENGAASTGNVTISGGTLSLSSKDDGIHADGSLSVSGGCITVLESYEGLEGSSITVSGGTLDITASDDGMNSTATSGTGIRFTDGSVFVYAGGDGLDANSRTQYQGIVFEGGDIRVVSTTSMNSSLDTEQGYSYSGGRVLAICPANAMTSEVSNCKNFRSVASNATLSLKAGQVVSVTNGKQTLMTLTMPCALSGYAVYLGTTGASITAGAMTS